MTVATDAARAKRVPFKIAGTFDLESADWSDVVIACCYDGSRPHVFYDLDDMIRFMRQRGGNWFGHAMGIYDGLAILERCRVLGTGAQVDRSQHRVSRIVIGGLTLRDSYSLWPAPLDELCAFAGLPVPHLPWPCICGQRTCTCGKCGGCGGYCRIREHAAKGDPDLEAYCVADCRALYAGLIKLDEVCLDHRIHLRYTLGRTAWIAAQDELGIPDSEISWPLYRHAKRADKGGRGIVVRPAAAGPGSHHDVCSAYPSQLAHAELPVGGVRELGDPSALLALRNGAPGIYTASVRVPDDLFVPPLSWRHSGGLHFPTGEFSGSWTLPELTAGMERGVVVEKVHSALVWEATAPIFAGLVERWYAIRREVGRKTPFGSWIGKLSKALAGVLAERPERSRVVFHPESVKICLRTGACRTGCTKKCGAYEQLDLYGHVWSFPYSRLGPSAYPQWSAYLRAGTRVAWLEQAERYGEDLCMGNTDSLWTLGRKAPEPLGSGLGEWEYQEAWTDGRFPSWNAYAYRNETGNLQIRGIPGLTEEDWKRGSGVIDRGVVTLGRAVKGTGGLFQRRRRQWTLPTATDRSIFGDRRMNSDGVTTPLSATEIREISARKHARRRERTT